MGSKNLKGGRKKKTDAWCGPPTSFLVVVSCGLAEAACMSARWLPRELLASATFMFLLMTSVSGVSAFSLGLDGPPGVSSAPKASYWQHTVHV